MWFYKEIHLSELVISYHIFFWKVKQQGRLWLIVAKLYKTMSKYYMEKNTEKEGIKAEK